MPPAQEPERGRRLLGGDAIARSARGLLESAVDDLCDILINLAETAANTVTIDDQSFTSAFLAADHYRGQAAQIGKGSDTSLQTAVWSFRHLMGQISNNQDFLNDIEEMDTASRAMGDHGVGLANLYAALERGRGVVGKVGDMIGGAAPGDTLSSILPVQKPAPIRFRIDDDVLRVDKVQAEAAPDVAAASAAAREQLERMADWLLESLRGSNIDYRVTQIVEQMRDRLSSAENIVQLAITNVSAAFMFEATASEMADGVASALRGFSEGIAMYAAQFPEWQRFAENSASLDLTPAEIEAVLDSAEQLAEDLMKAGPRVDAEVPKSIAALINLVRAPAQTSRRAAFAVVRTIENFVASVFQYCGAVVKSAGDGVKDGVKKTAYLVVLVAALEVATRVSPVAGKLVDGKWMQPAVEIVKKELSSAAELKGD